MKLHISYIAVIAVLAFPAYLQTATTLNRMADRFAEARVGISRAEAAEYLQVADALPEHLQAPMPVRKAVSK
jgi:hypothetical protein